MKENCFNCKHMKCAGYKYYICDLHDHHVSNGESCRDYEDED